MKKYLIVLQIFITAFAFANKDFSYQDLSGKDFSNQDLTGANFSGAILCNTFFNNANLTNADFTDSMLMGATFNNCTLVNTNYTNADLSNAYFQGTNTYSKGTIFNGACLYRTRFADGEGAHISWINTDFSNAKGLDCCTSPLFYYRCYDNSGNCIINTNRFPGAKFCNIILQGISFSMQNLKNSDFSGAILTDIMFCLADLENAKFDGAVLKNVNFKGAKNFEMPKNITLINVILQDGTVLTNTTSKEQSPAKITGKPKALEVFEGVASKGFAVSATGDDLNYQWEVSFDKGKTWQEVANATSSTYIPESDPSLDGSMYRCKVYNDGSSVYSSSAKYTVREAPKVEGIEVLQCKEKLSFDGSTVVAYEEYPIDLQVTAKGYKIKYQWYKNGAAINGATNAKYTIKKPIEGKSRYYCEVYNGDVKDQSSTFVLEVRECPMPASFEGHSLYVSDITDMGDPCRDMRMIFLNKNTLRVTMEDYEVSNPAWSYKRVSPTKASVTLKFKLYTNDEPVSKLNTISYSYSGEIEFKDNIFCLDLSDKKNGSFSGLFSDADIESADKTSLLSLPINQKIIVGDGTLMLLDKKNFALGEIQGTYSYKSNKNGTGVLKLNYKDGSDKCTAEISMLALSGNSGVAVVSTNWNEGKDKFISSSFEEFEIEN